MNRLTSGTASLFALLLVGGCHSDPTGDLRGGLVRLQAAPSTVLVTLGKDKKVQVTGLDDQGNPLDNNYVVKSVGSGITVTRDSSFLPIFINDTLLSVPGEAPTFQFIVHGNDLGVTNFVVTAGGLDMTIPVTVGPDPTAVPEATVTSSGPNASDVATITPPAPFLFDQGVTVAFNTGPAIILGVAPDGSSLTIFPPPGATGKGFITGLFASFLPQSLVSDSTDLAFAINPTVPSQPGTNSPSTAPDISGTPAFFDGGSFTGPDLTTDGPSQYYKFVAPADGDVTFTVNWGNASDIDFFFCTDTGCTSPDFGGGGATAAQPEVATQTVTAGTTYYIGLALFAGAVPPWISLSFQ